MKKIEKGEILGKDEYERQRAAIRRRVMTLKGRRRVPLGDHATLHFETRDTMLYQVHEMLRAEDSWTRDGAIEDELEAYNPLIPADGALSATLMIEYETPEERSHHLQAMLGIDRHLWLVVGDTEPVLAGFDGAQASASRISSVQYIRWPLDDERTRLIGQDGTVVRVVLDHPHYQAQAVLSEETRRELAGDLTELKVGS
jgi:hypothetical protein